MLKLYFIESNNENNQEVQSTKLLPIPRENSLHPSFNSTTAVKSININSDQSTDSTSSIPVSNNSYIEAFPPPVIPELSTSTFTFRGQKCQILERIIGYDILVYNHNEKTNLKKDTDNIPQNQAEQTDWIHINDEHLKSSTETNSIIDDHSSIPLSKKESISNLSVDSGINSNGFGTYGDVINVLLSLNKICFDWLNPNGKLQILDYLEIIES